MAEDYKLIDNEEKHRYEFQIDDKIAEIDYIKSNNGEIYLVHTEVPASLGGKGVGSQLAEKVLSDIERQGLRLVPLCPFVAGYIHKHPEWKRIVMYKRQNKMFHFHKTFCSKFSFINTKQNVHFIPFEYALNEIKASNTANS